MFYTGSFDKLHSPFILVRILGEPGGIYQEDVLASLTIFSEIIVIDFIIFKILVLIDSGYDIPISEIMVLFDTEQMIGKGVNH